MAAKAVLDGVKQTIHIDKEGNFLYCFEQSIEIVDVFLFGRQYLKCREQ